MHCRNCGAEINEKAEICVSCGVRPLSEKKFCQECGAETKPNQELCIKCGCLLKTSPDSQDQNWSYLKPYYQQEFAKIRDSREAYKGKWNWAAFFWSWIWAFSKGLWMMALIVIGGTLLTEGLLGFIFCIFMGFRGNYLYYNLVTKNNQLSF